MSGLISNWNLCLFNTATIVASLTILLSRSRHRLREQQPREATYPEGMDAKEFGSALFSEYFNNETHAVQILESCYGGPRNWSSIEWTKVETVENSTTTDTYDSRIFDALFGDSTAPAPENTGEEVLGMTIFWILLPLCLACVYHPLASSIHSVSRFRLYLHISPLFCLIDAVYIILQCREIRDQHPLSWRRSAEVVVKHRLRTFLSLTPTNPSSGDVEMQDSPTSQETNNSSQESPTQHVPVAGSSSRASIDPATSTPTTADRSQTPSETHSISRAPTSAVARAALNGYVRLIADIMTILVYTKICGFSGIRFWSCVADLFFGSWLIMEVFLALGYYAAPHDRLDEDDTAYSSVLVQNSNDLTPSEESSALTPLYFEVAISVILLYCKLEASSALWKFGTNIMDLTAEALFYYLVAVPFLTSWSLPHPFWLLAMICAVIPCLVWIGFMALEGCLHLAAVLAPPAGYIMGLSLMHALLERLVRRHCQRWFGTNIAGGTLNTISARTVVVVIGLHYVVYFVWLYESEGTSKASWTELLGRRLG